MKKLKLLIHDYDRGIITDEDLAHAIFDFDLVTEIAYTFLYVDRNSHDFIDALRRITK